MGKVEKAGGIILKKELDEFFCLLIYRQKYKDWTFPKGHCEDGEIPEETVTREIKE